MADDAVRKFHLQSFTPVSVHAPSRMLSLNDRFFLAGSCFSENLFRFLAGSYFNCTTSPFGNTYNPLSLADSIRRITAAELVEKNEIFRFRGLARHFAFHTGNCMPDIDQFHSAINRSIGTAAAFLKTATVLVITFGTSFVYFHRKSGRPVNNCHTLPAAEFERKLVKTDEIVNTLVPVLEMLKVKNPGLFTVFTLSPVRHLRDNAAENSLSKAMLRCAVEEIVTLPDTYYFPAYEIMLDELRDYRYYTGDLCHPGDTAVRYIMERFCESCFEPGVSGYLEKVTSLKKSLAHRPLHPDTESYRKFTKHLQEKISLLKKEFPMMIYPEQF